MRSYLKVIAPKGSYILLPNFGTWVSFQIQNPVTDEVQRTLGNIMSGVYCNDSSKLSPRGSMNIYLGAHALWGGDRHFQGCLTQGLNWHWYLETWSIITSPLEWGEHKARCSVESWLKSSLEQVHKVFGPTQLSFTQFPNVKCRIKILSCWNNTNWIIGLWSKSY